MTTWKRLKNITLSEISTGEITYTARAHSCEILKQKELFYDGKIRTVFASGRWGMGPTGKGLEGTLWGDEKGLYYDKGLGYTSVYAFTKI